jgi:methionyl-tRNA formyltransferase
MAVAAWEAIGDPWLDELADALWSKRQFSMVPIDYEAVPARPYSGPALSTEGLRIVFVGIPSDYGTSFLLHLVRQRANLVAVVCSTRWQRTHPKADLIARIAGHLGRPVEVAANANALPFSRTLKRYEPDLMVMASFDQILSPEPLGVPRLGWMNIHPSLLPRHRGPEPIYWAIVQGDTQTGITLHWTVPRIDAGPILDQRRVAIEADDTSGTLCKRIVRTGLKALDDTVLRLERGDHPARPAVAGQGSYEPPVRPVVLDWASPYEEIDRLVRAGQPDQPPSFIERAERRYVTGVALVRPRVKEPVGLLELGESQALAACRDQVIRLSFRRVGHRHATRPLRNQQFP